MLCLDLTSGIRFFESSRDIDSLPEELLLRSGELRVNVHILACPLFSVDFQKLLGQIPVKNLGDSQDQIFRKVVAYSAIQGIVTLSHSNRQADSAEDFERFTTSGPTNLGLLFVSTCLQRL